MAASPKADKASRHPRRAPTQQRSRERLHRILDAAERLFEKQGSEHATMSELAALAGISIGSLYQYFPDKRAILRTLAETYALECRRCIEGALSDVVDREELAVAFSSLYDRYFELFRQKPVMRDISGGMRADKELVALELRESKDCGAILAAAVRRAYPQADAKRVSILAFLIWQLGEETVRLALAHKTREAIALIDAYKGMALAAIAALE